MSVVLDKPVPSTRLTASKALSLSAKIWVGIACIGFALFIYHILFFYGGTTLSGDLAKWNDRLYNGLVTGDRLGNVALFAHVFLAALITFGAPLQLIPATQTKFRKFHQWNGRIYMVTALVMSISGLIMVLSPHRTVLGGWTMASGNIINATSILIASLVAWYYAVKGRFVQHREWALRLFMVANGVWFIRVMFGFWILINGGAPGHTDLFQGPFDIFLAFSHTLMPLAFMELYIRAGRSKNTFFKWLITGLIAALTIFLGMGIFMATIIFWI
ncbi:DUF2306 domain-containing protein [Marinoscillum pacificum]|uniref:DUF2306 domain-containing protein n=1 Tax=Marinoscillum pacificum TaxID=392723 RepID=UPI00215768B5|nr:DUF2306 domain-containing protein [Marinoscillum pacificum]